MALSAGEDIAVDRRINENLSLVRAIAVRLRRWYGWLDMGDLHSYAYLGLAMAAKRYQPDRGIAFRSFASQKGMFLAIDQMRKDGVVRRRGGKVGMMPASLGFDIPDPQAAKCRRAIETRDICRTLLAGLRKQDRRLLIMYYAEQLTFKEIARVFDISESAVCLRHKSIMRNLRHRASRRQMV
ncbi:MAG: sigma-70 family RNA polymerase sigma factor [Planctomycetota bacterium]|nr:sigma-70 family RNA polymerase sigma factor [Planctomycetota bacterium]